MSKCKVLFISMAVVVFLGGSAHAALVSFMADAPFSWSPSGAVVVQSFSSGDSATITMNAESQSNFTIVMTATNKGTFTWEGYLLELDPAGAATFVPDSASSFEFQSADYPDIWTIMFSAPDEVPVGTLAGFKFDINIPDGGSYTFTLTQTPIPEPATVALLGLGSLALFVRKRKRG